MHLKDPAAAVAGFFYELARLLNISRPLLYMHLQKQEAAGLVKGQLELSDDGKAMKYYEVLAFNIAHTPQTLLTAATDP